MSVYTILHSAKQTAIQRTIMYQYVPNYMRIATKISSASNSNPSSPTKQNPRIYDGYAGFLCLAFRCYPCVYPLRLFLPLKQCKNIPLWPSGRSGFFYARLTASIYSSMCFLLSNFILSEQCAYTSNVKLAVAWPRFSCTVLMSSPS